MIDNYPIISILSPCYNVEAYLPQCLDSIISQTYTNLQIVLIDDGSKDDTWKIMQNYAVRDSRIEIYHQENQGVAITRNNLLDKVKGDYVLFVDSDDWCELDMVEFLVSKSKEHNADVTICSMVINDTQANLEYIEKILSQEECIKAFLFHNELRGSLCNKLVATSLLHNVRFHCGISFGEDALFCWHFFQHAKSIVMTNRQLYHYRMNETSLSHEDFGPKKFSAYMVWLTICNDTEKLFPQFADIAKGHFCFGMLLLYKNALDSKYSYDESIKTLQGVVKRYRYLMIRKKCANRKWAIYSLLVYLPYKLIQKFS